MRRGEVTVSGFMRGERQRKHYERSQKSKATKRVLSVEFAIQQRVKKQFFIDSNLQFLVFTARTSDRVQRRQVWAAEKQNNGRREYSYYSQVVLQIQIQIQIQIL